VQEDHIEVAARSLAEENMSGLVGIAGPGRSLGFEVLHSLAAEDIVVGPVVGPEAGLEAGPEAGRNSL